MIPEFISESESSWEFLKKTPLPIFIYGMGDGAEKILSVFERSGIPVAGFFASDEFVRGHSFHGHLVHSLSEVEKAVEDFITVLAFGAGYESLYNRILSIAERHTLLAPDVPVTGGGLFTREYCEENADKLMKVYSLLADSVSRETFADVINFRISGKIHYLHRCTSEKETVFRNILMLPENEDYIDMGAYNGDTVLEYARITNGRHKSIYALEPDPRNYKKLVKNTEGMQGVHLFNAAAWNENGEVEFLARSGRNARVSEGAGGHIKMIPAISGDSLTEKAGYIKMDVEGAEKQAIEGCRELIKKGCRLNIALYHRTEDIFEIPLQIHEINPSLKMYMRHLMYIPAWETNLYCVP